MREFLLRKLIKDADNVHSAAVRSRYGILAGCVGIILNLALFAAKFIAGSLTTSIAITADAFNNLSDAGSSVVTLIGFKMAALPSDSEHPFGHGRIEYLSGLAVSMAILMVGVELFKGSLNKILHPQVVEFSLLSMAILVASILVKLWMAWFNHTLSVRICSSAMKATCMDSLTDAVATSAVFLGALAARFTGLRIDGWTGLLVAFFIFYSGFSTARDSLSPLLGAAPDPELVREIEQTVLSHKPVTGVHDLIIHDYGPGRRIVSLHAEVPSTLNILKIHDAIDHIELELRQKYGCDATIHMDPVAVDDPETQKLHQRVAELAAGIDPAITIHDFRIVKGPTHTNLIFDVTVPHKFRLTDVAVGKQVREGVRAFGPRYFAVIRVEQAFI